MKQKKIVERWNKKIHIYLGLYLLFFLWLFGFSGLLLNHHWDFTKFWEDRNEIKYAKTIQLSKERAPYPLAQEIRDRLNLNGSIINLAYSNDSILLNFIISKPGTRSDIQANLKDGKITVTEAKFNKWGIMRALHTLRNPTLNEKSERYQTVIASIWSISIDFVSMGLIVICLGGWYMWLQISGKRFYLGLISISLGSILCIYLLMV